MMQIGDLIKALEKDFANPEKDWIFLHFLDKTISESPDGFISDSQEIYYDKKDGHFHSRIIHTNGGNMFDGRTWGYTVLSSVKLWTVMNSAKTNLRSIYCYEDDATFEADYKQLMQMLIGWERVR